MEPVFLLDKYSSGIHNAVKTLSRSGKSPGEEVNEGCLHSCSGLVREQEKAEQVPVCMSDPSCIILLPCRVFIRK